MRPFDTPNTPPTPPHALGPGDPFGSRGLTIPSFRHGPLGSGQNVPRDRRVQSGEQPFFLPPNPFGAATAGYPVGDGSDHAGRTARPMPAGTRSRGGEKGRVEQTGVA